MCRSILILAIAAPHAVAADLLPADRPIQQAVDHYIRQQWKELGIKPARPAADATILRRLTLDLNGRVPTAAEVQAYLADRSPDKKAKLVDRLMASPAFQRHLVTELDAQFSGPSGRKGGQGSIREYLTLAVKENRPWDKVFRDLVLAEEKAPGQKGASQFIKSRVRDLDRLTNDVSVLFFGVNISCAQCHDHPLVADWKQDHYYGMKSFLARSFDAGRFLGERDTGVVTFKTPKNVQKTAKMMFLTGKVIDAPGSDVKAPPLGKKRQPKGKGGSPPTAPKWSARAALVEVALSPEGSKFLSRTMVNRTWARLFGLGLVTPVDQMHSENPPSHPELLEWLARDTASHGYDMRRLIKGLVLSDAYALSSRYEGEKWPLHRSFAVARPRALTPMQMATSLKVATLAPGEFGKPADLEGKITNLENSARGFASLIEHPPGDDFQIGVSEALLFSNSDRIQREFLGDGRNVLVGTLKETKGLEMAAELAVLNVLSRPATEEEKKAIVAYITARKEKPADAWRQAVWALLTSAEFRFNY